MEAASSRPPPPPPAPASSSPKGTRLEFEKALPAFSSPSFASRTPVSIARSVLETMCHCPVLDIEKELAATVIKGAVDSHIRGYVLTSGTLCAAQVAEWLCCNMPESMRAATVSTVARALDKVVTNAAAVAAEATGSQAPVFGQYSKNHTVVLLSCRLRPPPRLHQPLSSAGLHPSTPQKTGRWLCTLRAFHLLPLPPPRRARRCVHPHPVRPVVVFLSLVAAAAQHGARGVIAGRPSSVRRRRRQATVTAAPRQPS